MYREKLLGLSIAVLITSGCASPDTKKATTEMAAPINCATAEGDIRALSAEKASTSQEIAAGVTSIVPVSAVAHMFQGKEGETLKVSSGDYNDALDKKIGQIKKTCGIK